MELKSPSGFHMLKFRQSTELYIYICNHKTQDRQHHLPQQGHQTTFTAVAMVPAPHTGHADALSLSAESEQALHITKVHFEEDHKSNLSNLKPDYQKIAVITFLTKFRLILIS